MSMEKIGILLKRIHFVRLALGLILVNVLVFVFVVMPKQTSIVALQGSYASLRKEVAGEQAKVRNLQMRLGKLEEARKNLETMYKEILLPRRTGVTEIRMELEQLTQKLQIQREDFSYTYNDLPDVKVQQFSLAVPIEGNYRNIRRLINEIERSRHFLILDRVVLSSEQKKGDLLTLDFRLSTYLVEEDEIQN